ncbi:glycerophosphodiester phosphodiesterase [Amycolatopsis regifaucium]|uniref:glycerophosphodiester phosphodiesterase n=1 Tax=Amycolatopsis regifaucium TaxID=546365 RepID=A0A154MLI2_9PSEU|nr:glycerophosphodiester phosphodiesterase [Amycolatopsis regifaucium]KZB85126.1 glycerophosphodiester phosphodiesterase [Amycolatopsis regifaucium]OKA04149.1 glycerophosphodiester phosphodiesterase [Amycolatopsis regifaucium]SFH93104.1 glycerophosphoryl diester phosphodiesterase [Amycolatopsis regifaucium]
MRKRLGVLALSGLAVLSVTGLAGAAEPGAQEVSALAKSHDGPVIVGHRGAPGYRPEHTLASYELAYRQGVDWVDVDLVPTKDGRLVARHENEIGGTTDVAKHPEFANRKTTKIIDGTSFTGWFTEDFTLAELKTLRATERIPQLRPNNRIYDGRYQIATYQEVLDLTRRLGRELRRELGTYPEIKHSTYFSSIKNPTEPKLVELLKRNGLNHPKAPVIIQSFEVSNLIALSRQVRVPLLQLTSATGAPADFVAKGDPRTYADLVTPAGLKEISRYADYLGPEKAQVIPVVNGALGQPTRLVADAHQAGLKVGPYTFRNENNFLPQNLRSSANLAEYGNAFAEQEAFLKAGVDGYFADHPDTALEAVKAFQGR